MSFHVFGPPPAADASRAERLHYLRRFYLRPLPLSLPVLVFAVLAEWGSWWLVPLGVGAVLWVQGFSRSAVRSVASGRRARTHAAERPAPASVRVVLFATTLLGGQP